MPRILDIADGFSSASEPDQGSLSTNALKSFANDAAFVADKGSAAAAGDIYFNTTNNVPRYYDGSGWENIDSKFEVYANDAAFVTAKGSAAAAGDQYYNSTDNVLRYYDANLTAWTSVVSIDGEQTLTNKTATGLKINDLYYDITAKSADYIITDSDGITTVNVDDTSSDRTITLPTAADNTDRIIIIKNTSTDKGKVTVDGEGAETIDGFTTIDLDFKNAYIMIQCDGTEWHIISENVTSAKKSYSLTVSGTNYTTIKATGRPYRDIDGNWFFEFNIVGSLTGSTNYIQLTVTGVTFESTSNNTQALASYFYAAATDETTYAITDPGASTLQIQAETSQSYQRVAVSGDVALNAKPTFVE